MAAHGPSGARGPAQTAADMLAEMGDVHNVPSAVDADRLGAIDALAAQYYEAKCRASAAIGASVPRASCTAADAVARAA